MYAPIRMPGPLFDEIAAGGGSREAVAFLVEGERTRRLLLLRELLDRLDEHPGILGPLDAAEIWPVLERAAARAPRPVERLLLSPQVGSWLAHTLRRLHGTASGPPLWADAGQLAAVAATAALLAGTGAELTLPARAATLSLPTLGLIRLPRPPADAFHPVRVSVSSGTLTVRQEKTGRATSAGTGETRGGGTSGGTGGRQGDLVVVRPLTDPESAHWLPVHRLPVHPPAQAGPRAGTGPHQVQLDDIDPYRDLDEPIAPSRVGPEELSRWQDLFRDALSVLRRDDAEAGALRPEEISRIVPWHPQDSGRKLPVPAAGLSASTGDAFGSMVVARPGNGLALAETLVHEFQHSKLGALLHLFPMLDDDRDERYYAPWRSDPRHLPGLLHGAYAFVGVAGFWRDRMGDKAADPEELAPFQFALRRLQTRMVLRTLATRARLTGPGRRLVAGLTHTVDGWLREPVDGGAAERAGAAAAGHRVEWRLRNLRCPESERTALLAAFGSGDVPVSVPGQPPLITPAAADRAYWQDTRGSLYLRPRPAPGAAATADELLTAGDATAARDRYEAGARALAGDPHPMAGWLLAQAALCPGHRRLLARPERFAAVAGEYDPGSWDRIARWLARTAPASRTSP
ncbi:HEXXH motif domain-containing protein [Streptomyces sp. BE308]|uniref:HEXXH motif domain-containing protein n=1 Tax=Streptomyces sp. BE308 TaxID=3002529 RepID=UPI002E75BF25|nr:HEXXH motif domain-containing protein [Streptomyces sp. BE308]MEE1794578.1 HEXXH motif domain-containing protein [Streptomyces sp. BE308]